MTNCERFEELISSMLDGEITDSERNELKEHLAQCADCRELLSVLETVDSASEGGEVEPPEELYSGVMEKIRQADGKKAVKPKRFGKIAARWLAAAACCAIIVFVAPKAANLGCGSSDAVDMTANEMTMAKPGAAGKEESVWDDSFQQSTDMAAPPDTAYPADTPNYGDGDASTGSENDDVAGGSYVDTMNSCLERMHAEYEGMYAVVFVFDTLPEEMNGDAFEQAEDGVWTLTVSSAQADALAEQGYSTYYQGTDSDSALVIYITAKTE